MASFQDIFFQPRRCGPRVISLFLCIALFISFGIRYRRHFVSHRLQNRGTSKAIPPAVITPYETVLLIGLVNIPHTFANIQVVTTTRDDYKSVLERMILPEVSGIILLAYFAILEVFEELAFRKYFTRPYWAKKVMLPDVEVSTETTKEDLENMRIKATIADTAAEQRRDTRSASTTPTASDERSSIWQRINAYFKQQLPELTPSNMLARYHIRTFIKAIIAMTFLNAAESMFCVSNDIGDADLADPLDMSKPSFLIFVLLGDVLYSERYTATGPELAV